MAVWFVSRHPGARDLARSLGLSVDHWATHLEPTLITAQDQVYGTLPVSLAAEVCAQGARYFHLTLNVPAHLRGRELTASEMQALNARFEEFIVTRA